MDNDTYLSLLSRSLPLLLKGAAMTVQIFFSSASLGLALGCLWGTVSCNKLRIPVFSQMIEYLTFVLRAIPFFVQLILVYFVLPDILGINLDPFPASVIALGLCSSGYVAQIVRGGLNAIALGQWESAFSLGLNTLQSLRYIIIPQVGRNILPMLNNELDGLLKSTSIVSSIGMLELTRMGMNIVSREMQPVPIYLTVALFYLGLSASLHVVAKALERRLIYVKN
ncbi:MAG TPA: amino acid ABC transporter permease [Parachlamydiales bacterium]|nr:amino acid ABC transporter permease [Parachlamydiales bacterium]